MKAIRPKAFIPIVCRFSALEALDVQPVQPSLYGGVSTLSLGLSQEHAVAQQLRLVDPAVTPEEVSLLGIAWLHDLPATESGSFSKIRPCDVKYRDVARFIACQTQAPANEKRQPNSNQNVERRIKDKRVSRH